jgi:hypothetical protein
MNASIIIIIIITKFQNVGIQSNNVEYIYSNLLILKKKRKIMKRTYCAFNSQSLSFLDDDDEISSPYFSLFFFSFSLIFTLILLCI